MSHGMNNDLTPINKIIANGKVFHRELLGLVWGLVIFDSFINDLEGEMVCKLHFNSVLNWKALQIIMRALIARGNERS